MSMDQWISFAGSCIYRFGEAALIVYLLHQQFYLRSEVEDLKTQLGVIKDGN